MFPQRRSMERKAEGRMRPVSGAGGKGDGRQELRKGCGTGVGRVLRCARGPRRTVWLCASRSSGGSFLVVAFVLGRLRPPVQHLVREPVQEQGQEQPDHGDDMGEIKRDIYVCPYEWRRRVSIAMFRRLHTL